MSRKRIMIEEFASWQKPILSIANEGIAEKGNRYIVGAEPTGTFAGLSSNDIAWYDGTEWQTDTPSTGWKAYDLNQGKVLTFVNNEWVADASLVNKMDKVSGGTEDNLVALDATGNAKDSGVKTPVFDEVLGCILMEFVEPS